MLNIFNIFKPKKEVELNYDMDNIPMRIIVNPKTKQEKELQRKFKEFKAKDIFYNCKWKEEYKLEDGDLLQLLNLLTSDNPKNLRAKFNRDIEFAKKHNLKEPCNTDMLVSKQIDKQFARLNLKNKKVVDCIISEIKDYYGNIPMFDYMGKYYKLFYINKDLSNYISKQERDEVLKNSNAFLSENTKQNPNIFYKIDGWQDSEFQKIVDMSNYLLKARKDYERERNEKERKEKQDRELEEKIRDIARDEAMLWSNL